MEKTLTFIPNKIERFRRFRYWSTRTGLSVAFVCSSLVRLTIKPNILYFSLFLIGFICVSIHLASPAQMSYHCDISYRNIVICLSMINNSSTISFSRHLCGEIFYAVTGSLEFFSNLWSKIPLRASTWWIKRNFLIQNPYKNSFFYWNSSTQNDSLLWIVWMRLLVVLFIIVILVKWVWVKLRNTDRKRIPCTHWYC